MAEQYAVGEHTAAYCPVCQEHCDQTIMTMDGARIATMTCPICGSLSTCVPPAAARKARAPRAKKGAAILPSVTSRWEAAMAAAPGTAQRYTMTGHDRLGDRVLHEQFGPGVVLKLAAQKCLVLFQDQERMMASANSGEGVSWPLSSPASPPDVPDGLCAVRHG